MFLLRYLGHMELKQRTGRYLLYAIGEIVLVVIGILIALQINNWNEERKQDQQRLDLIERLHRDFRATLNILEENIEIAIFHDEALIRVLKFAANESNESSVEQVRNDAASAFKMLDASINLASYESAKTTGEIGLLKEDSINELFIQFEQLSRRLEYNSRMVSEDNILGSTKNLRYQLGSLRTLFPGSPFRAKMFEIADEDYQSTLAQKEVYAFFEAAQNMKRIQRGELEKLKVIVEDILKALNERV